MFAPTHTLVPHGSTKSYACAPASITLSRLLRSFLLGIFIPCFAAFSQDIPQDTLSLPEQSEQTDNESLQEEIPQRNDSGTERIAPGRAVLEALDNGEFPPVVAQYEQTVKVTSQPYTYSNLTSWSQVPAQNKRLNLFSEPTENYCSDYRIRRVRLRVHLKVGMDDYRFGDMGFTYTVTGTVTGYKNGTPPTQVGPSYNFSVTVERRKPEQVWRSVWIDVPINGYDYFEIAGVTATPLTLTSQLSNVVGPANQALNRLRSQIRMEFSMEEDIRWRVDDGNGNLLDVVELEPLGRVSNEIGVLIDNPVNFEWNHAAECEPDAFPSYELQLLRLFNRSQAVNADAATTNEFNVTETVDWGRALSIETGNPEREIELTVAEGRGYYLWRVRPIGDYYPGKNANDRNWGAWSKSFDDGEQLQFEENGSGVITVSLLVNGTPNQVTDQEKLNSVIFYGGLDYNHVTETFEQKNWIYSRTFSEGEEGTRIAERMTYATPLLRARQIQGHVQTDDYSVLSETMYDYAGRGAVSTLAAPVKNVIPGVSGHPVGDWAGFFYRPNFADYRAEQFDDDLNYRDPQPMGGDVATYYSDVNAHAEPNIPSAEGFPFMRTLYYPDANSRTMELGGAGLHHRLGGPDPTATPAPDDHTTKVLYGSASESVLVALFGDEAPDHNAVRAVYTIDPNKVTSVQYLSKEGQTLASFLVKASSNPYLSTVLGEGEAVIGEQPNEVMEYKGKPMSLQDGDVFYFVPLVVESAGTSINFEYKITPKTFDLCALGCRTCKYKINIAVYSASYPDEPVYETGGSGDPDIDLTGIDFCGTSSEAITISNVAAKNPDHLLANWPGTFTEVGTYYVLLRLEVDNDDPIANRPYTEVWEVDGIRNAIRDEIETDFLSSSQVPGSSIRELLESGDLQQVYDILDDPVAAGLTDVEVTINWVDENDHSKGIESWTVRKEVTAPDESCWEIEIPYLTCPTGLPYESEMKNGQAGYQIGLEVGDDMSFEKLLYDRWGDVDVVGSGMAWGDASGQRNGLNSYFRRDGGNLYTGVPNNGVGQFDLLIENMLADNSLYTIGELWNAWNEIISEFGYRATENGTGNPAHYDDEYDLLEDFLGRVGKTYEGTSTTPYGTTGYLENAHRYFNPAADPQGDCETQLVTLYGATNTWGRDPKTGELLDSDSDPNNDKKWEMLFTCVNRGEPTPDELEKLGAICEDAYENGVFSYECAVAQASIIENKCRAHCESLRDGFRRQLIRRYHESDYVIEGETYTDQGEKIDWGTNPPTIMGTTTEVNVVTRLELECQVELVVARCEGDCDVTLEWWNPNNPEQGVKSIGTPTEAEKILKVLSWYADIRLPQSGVCNGQGAELLSTSDPYFGIHKARVLVNRMNQALENYIAGLSGTETGSANCSAIYEDIFLPLMSEDALGASYMETHCHFCETPVGYDAGGSGDGSGSCCPGHEPWGDLFTFDEYTSGEFVLESGGEEGYEKCILKYRRTCIRNGVPYITEQELCGNICFDICSTSVCFKWTDEDNLGENDVVNISEPSCEKQWSRRLLEEIERQVDEEIERSAREFRVAYMGKCLVPENLEDELKITKQAAYYHFTLYYYDRAGHLVRTVPPAGVRPLAYGLRSRTQHPAHELVTSYEYNSLGQMVRKNTPDGGTTVYWYDNVGRMRLSQDARQLAGNKVSYSRYDRLSRVVEIGQCTEPNGGLLSAVLSGSNTTWPQHSTHGTEERVFTFYSRRYEPDVSDEPYFDLPRNGTYLKGTYQRFTLHRIAHTMAEIPVVDPYDETDQNQWVHTQYSYDPHGNVEWVRQEIPGLGANYARYEYDLISGNVVGLFYNEGWKDGFSHCYRYDPDNRLLEVKTSRDGELWDSDARYKYYPHGPLKRAEYGDDSIQGIDYVHTIHGWLKGVNHPALGHDRTFDPGNDGSPGAMSTPHVQYARDAFGMMLGYYEGDFLRASSPYESDGTPEFHLAAASGGNLYNGNISTWVTHTQKVGAAGLQYEELAGEQYRYDVLNRLIGSTFHVYSSASYQFDGIANPSQYKTNYSYDPNGNLLTLHRWGNKTGTDMLMDKLTYSYKTGTNQLIRLRDMQGPFDEVDIGRYTNDIDDAVSTAGGVGNAKAIGSEPSDRYVYDEIGNLIEDKSEVPEIGGTVGTGDVIEWSVYGKVRKVIKYNGTILEFTYDASGNRVRKTVKEPNTMQSKKTYYVYEAGGKVAAIYQTKCDGDVYDGPPGMDSDGDGWPDAADNCPSISNPNQKDSDNDGIGDACDLCKCKSAIVEPQSAVDTDNDGIGNACDPQIGIYNPPGSVDSDGDGIAEDRPDHPDNCPCVFNPGPPGGQPDADQDGIGNACEECSLALAEWMIYGSAAEGRVATVKPKGIGFRSGLWGDTNLVNIAPSGMPPALVEPFLFTRVIAEKEFELKDHLGNVRVVVSDMKLNGDPDNGSSGWVASPASGMPPFMADMRAYNNYYPFGMLQPGRHWSTEGYRYGYNGKEMDNEMHDEPTAGTSGTGNSYDYGFRIYDPRIAKFLSVDPLTEHYPSWSPYPFAMNRAVDGVDLDGKEWTGTIHVYSNGWIVEKTTIKIKVVNSGVSPAKVADVVANMTSSFRQLHTATDHSHKRRYERKIEVEYVSDRSQVNDQDFVMEFVESKEDETSGVTLKDQRQADATLRGENRDEIGGLGDMSNPYILIYVGAKSNGLVGGLIASHEITHTGGEGHIDNDRAMNEGQVSPEVRNAYRAGEQSNNLMVSGQNSLIPYVGAASDISLHNTQLYRISTKIFIPTPLSPTATERPSQGTQGAVDNTGTRAPLPDIVNPNYNVERHNNAYTP